MPLVELIPSLTTSTETVNAMQSFVATTLGKQPIEATDRAGFIVNSLLVPYRLSECTKPATQAPPTSTRA